LKGSLSSAMSRTTGELIELRPSDVWRAREIAAEMDGVQEVQTYGDLLHIFVDDAARRMPQVEAGLLAQGIVVEGIRQTRPRMEEAFISLIRRRLAEKPTL